MKDWTQDFRYSVRTLVKNRAFAAVAIATLAIGIGANTSIFTVLDAVVLRGLPYTGARAARHRVGGLRRGGTVLARVVSSLDFRDFHEMGTLFDGFAAGRVSSVNLTGTGDPEQVSLGRVTYDFFPLLGIEPALGRGFEEREDVVNGPDVVMLSDGLWRRRFGSDPAVVGRSIQMNGTAHEVVGVMPPDFELHFPGTDSSTTRSCGHLFRTRTWARGIERS